MTYINIYIYIQPDKQDIQTAIQYIQANRGESRQRQRQTGGKKMQADRQTGRQRVKE